MWANQESSEAKLIFKIKDAETGMDSILWKAMEKNFPTLKSYVMMIEDDRPAG